MQCASAFNGTVWTKVTAENPTTVAPDPSGRFPLLSRPDTSRTDHPKVIECRP